MGWRTRDRHPTVRSGTSATITGVSHRFDLPFPGAAVLAATLITATVAVGCGSSPTQTQTDNTTDGTATPTSAPTVLALISDDKQLSTLTAALGSAGLVQRFEATGPYTVFAPTNDAWEQLGTNRVEALMTKQSKNLRQGLLTHPAKVRFLSSDLTDGRRLRSLGGPSLVIRVKGTTTTVNGAEIVVPDQQAGNGVVHVINKVLR